MGANMTKARNATAYNENFDEILKTVSIDYSNPEIQDIQGAVLELLTRVKDKINERGYYKISRIEPCGSMVEETAVWKDYEFGVSEHTACAEFDFLAVLEKPSHMEIDRNSCQLCADVTHLCADVTSNKIGLSKVPFFSFANECDDMFKEELSSAIVSSCSCYRCCHYEAPLRYGLNRSFKARSTQDRPGCDKCTINKPTGHLQIDTLFINDGSSSLILMWTSDAMTLVASGKYYVMTTYRIKQLPILIDFLPAFELFKPNENNEFAFELFKPNENNEFAFELFKPNENNELIDFLPAFELFKPNENNELQHDCFIVPKRCVQHDGDSTWRISSCMAEIDHIVNKMSDKHRKCFKILKYCRQIDEQLPSYDVKTAVLNHSRTCTNSSEDCYTCVTAIVKELERDYKRVCLKSFSSKANLVPKGDTFNLKERLDDIAVLRRRIRE